MISSDTLLKVVTLIATTAVAIAVAIISWKQWRLSQEKLRLDLFNRRFDVYMRVLDLYQELLQWKGTAEQNALYIPFIKAVRESRFIFPRKSPVRFEEPSTADFLPRLPSKMNNLGWNMRFFNRRKVFKSN